MQLESAAISDIRYDEGRAKLFVRFLDGDEYVYVGVPGVGIAKRTSDITGGRRRE